MGYKAQCEKRVNRINTDQTIRFGKRLLTLIKSDNKLTLVFRISLRPLRVARSWVNVHVNLK